MTRFAVEVSGENPSLAAAEVAGAAEALGGSSAGSPGPELPRGLVPVDLTDEPAAGALAGRLALAWRVLRPWEAGDARATRDAFRDAGRSGRSAMLRPLGAPRSSRGELPHFGKAYADGGGRIDLDHPQRRFYVAELSPDRWWVGEEVGAVDRRAFDARRLQHLPFRRPVSLAPRLGRVLVNLARVRAGDRVIDPFVGTGALLLEAALVGAEVEAVDRDAQMVRGAMQNFAHLGLRLARAEVADSAAAAAAGSAPFDALVTDPPYGRASGSGGEPVVSLLGRVLPAWADRVRPGGHAALVAPGGIVPFSGEWTELAAVGDRVHRSLTREFRAYRRAGPGQ